MGLTLEKLAATRAPLNVRSMSGSITSSHSTPLLQIKTTPS